MQMEAHCEGGAGAAGQPVLAAQIVAIGGEIELAGIGQPELGAIAVMRCGDPLMPAFFGALAAQHAWGWAERAVRADLDRVGVGDDHYGMSGAGARGPLPGRLRPAVAAAIDDDAVAPVTQLEREEAGMSV